VRRGQAEAACPLGPVSIRIWLSTKRIVTCSRAYLAPAENSAKPGRGQGPQSGMGGWYRDANASGLCIILPREGGGAATSPGFRRDDADSARAGVHFVRRLGPGSRQA
jgi:hypothetical protein